MTETDQINTMTEPANRKRILLVDDQAEVCNAMRRLLRQDGHEVLTAHSADDAMRMLDGHEIDVIVSDQQMPKRTGTDLLYEVQKRYPDTVRMILSGAADIEIVARAMEDGAIYKFLTKPIVPALLRANISEACAKVDSLKKASRKDDPLGDTMTGLPNRALMRQIFDGLCIETVMENRVALLFMLQIDQYDSVVTSFGQSAGREFECCVAQMLAHDLRPDWFIGHDSSGILLLLTKAADPLNLATWLDKKLGELFSKPLTVQDHLITATPHIGATTTEDCREFDSLVDRARAAMKSCSDSRGITIQFYEPRLLDAFRDRLQLESDLRRAVAEKSFEIYYQPQFDLTNRKIVGVEALIRWPHETRGMISPADFIPIAEKVGLIGAIGFFVLETATRQLVEWRNKYPKLRKLAVNVSPLQLRDPAFVEQVSAVIDRAGLPREYLVLEITESAAISDNEAIASCLEQLGDAGFSLSIDDFGTGYANLSSLTRFAFTQIKIDRSLLPGRDTRSTNLFEDIVAMGRKLGVDVIAEGVETSDDLAAVQAAHCTLVQGYHFSRPVDADTLSRLLDASDLAAD
jgi:EAL domain-containing protein (putative c-di-GMP-specific phosphodiesterase class I)/FixJ family two-component response regulator